MDENLNKGIKHRIGKEREQQRNGRKKPLKHVKRPLTHKSKNKNMLEKFFHLNSGKWFTEKCATLFMKFRLI